MRIDGEVVKPGSKGQPKTFEVSRITKKCEVQRISSNRLACVHELHPPFPLPTSHFPLRFALLTSPNTSLNPLPRPIPSVRIILTEGKKRQIRLMARSVGLHVQRLHRTHFAGIGLAGLSAAGDWAPLTDQELEVLRAAVTWRMASRLADTKVPSNNTGRPAGVS